MTVALLGQADAPFPPFPFDTSAQDCRTLADGVISCVSRSTGPNDTLTMAWLVLGFWIVGVILCLYAGRDMERRGQSGGLWGAVVLFGGLFGIVVWRLARKRLPVMPNPRAASESRYGRGVRPGALPWRSWR